MRTALILATAILGTAAFALAGCNKGGATSATKTAGPAPAAGGGAFPARRPGLWAITRLHDGKPSGGAMGGAMKTCIDAATDAAMGALTAGARELCPEQSSSRGLDGSWSFASTCHFGPGGTMHTTGVARGDFNASYKVHSESDTTGAQIASMNGHHVTDLTATYEGACPADMAPGDVLLPNGMKVNPQKMMAGAGHPPAPN